MDLKQENTEMLCSHFTQPTDDDEMLTAGQVLFSGQEEE